MTEIMDEYQVKKLEHRVNHCIEVPGSKSLSIRSLCISAFARGVSTIDNLSASDDTMHCLKSINSLGIRVDEDLEKGKVAVYGEGGYIPNRQAGINVGSAGTCARFLTALLSAGDGRFFIDASEQMRGRQMKHLLDALMSIGVTFTFLNGKDFLPFYLDSRNVGPAGTIEINCNVSCQFLVGLLMALPLYKRDFHISVFDTVHAASYVDMTIDIMKKFGVDVENEGYKKFYIIKKDAYAATDITIESDVSSACYFYSIPLLLGGEIFISNISLGSLQGEIQYLQLLEKLGCVVTERDNGVAVKKKDAMNYPGFEIDMNDFSDQALTAAVLGVFANGPVAIKNIGHIKYQECDRINACVTEMSKLGIRCQETTNGIVVYPGKVRPGVVDSYGDHRMAMAFSLIGLCQNGIRIKNPSCVSKSFPGYFSQLETLYH